MNKILKPHIQSKLVNELKEISIKFYSHQSLRDRISFCISKYIKEQEKWNKENEELSINI